MFTTRRRLNCNQAVSGYMCGITGILQSPVAGPNPGSYIHPMCDALRHRGPDAGGVWLDDHAGTLALGHRRLSILDLSERGAQPMTSASGRFVLVFNGEIYNFRDLRAELVSLGHCFAGTSDTEVALAGIEQWGFEHALTRFEGMFALGLWDKADRCLYLARDRFGEKPVYYGVHANVFLFASQLSALRPHPAFSPVIDRDALTLLLRYDYIPAPHSIFEHYRKLPAGSWLKVDSDLTVGQPRPYWDIDRQAEQTPLDISAHEAVGELDRLLQRSVREKMVADVPLGAFLSGGIDSSLIVSMMGAISHKPVQTFTIGFDDKKRNEADEAARTAQYLGTDHHELYLTDADLRDVVPQIPAIYDEPFADASQIPTSIVCRLARRHVSVALSGDGGDELFAGYKRYATTVQRWRRARKTPRSLRRLRAGYLAAIQSRLRPEKRAKYLKTSRMQRAGHDLRCFYECQMSFWADPERVVFHGRLPATPFTRVAAARAESRPWQWLMTTDMRTYLPEDVLTKVDRASMAASLETRAPLLDSRLAQFALRLPLDMKVRDGTLKWLPRQLLGHYLPAEVLERPKKGFGVPLKQWLRGPLRPWAAALLAPERLRRGGYLDAAIITPLWQDHIHGRADWTWPLWNVLMFEAWREHFFKGWPAAI